MRLTKLCLLIVSAMNALGEIGDVPKLKEMSRHLETVTLLNPTNAQQELDWLVGVWRCADVAFPKPPSKSDSYAMLRRIEIPDDGITFPGTQTNSVLLYLHCTFTTNIAGYISPKDETHMVEIRGQDFIYFPGDYFVLKRPRTNYPAFFILQHQDSGDLLLFRREKEKSTESRDQRSHPEKTRSQLNSPWPFESVDFSLVSGRYGVGLLPRQEGHSDGERRTSLIQFG